MFFFMLQCVDFLSLCCNHQSNWLVLIGGTLDSSITTAFIMLLLRREKSVLILVLKSSFEHLLSECHV